jgi:hypothetical protein
MEMKLDLRIARILGADAFAFAIGTSPMASGASVVAFGLVLASTVA